MGESCHIINILLTELSRSVWENLDLGHEYRPHFVRSVRTTSVKILPAISKIGNGESENRNGERGTGNGNGEFTKRGNL